MPLAQSNIVRRKSSGRISRSYKNLGEMQDEIEAFLRNTIPLCGEALSALAGGSAKKTGEKQLAVWLTKELTAHAQEGKKVFSFFNEDPDSRKKSRTIDMTVIPSVGLARIKVGTRDYGRQDCFYCVEAKRLPTPEGGSVEGDRTREYVVGDWAARSKQGKRKSGGIERFKEGEHAADISRSGMIAFVQDDTPQYWHTTLNGWIQALITTPIPAHKAKWSVADLLAVMSPASGHSNFAEYSSKHARQTQDDIIELQHFWLYLQ